MTKFDQIKLLKKIGEGGNGQVFTARMATKEKDLFAIKILKNSRINQALYNRFKAEISFLSAEKSNTGILPIYDYCLPEFEKLKSEKAWYTMPIAIPIKTFIKKSSPSPSELVEIFIDYSRTLSVLNSQEKYHRDIKPDNLFILGDRPVIGDFGLVKFPDKENITDNRKLGPIYFIAPEMLNSPDKADYNKVDIYSLAKSLWVLMANQNYPVPGEHDLTYKPIHLSTYVAQQRIGIIDVLLNRATKLDVSQRITMKEFHDELAAWINPKHLNAEMPDIEDQTKQLAYILQPNIQEEERRRHLTEVVNILNREIQLDTDKAFDNIGKNLPLPFNVGNNPTIINAETLSGKGQIINDLVSREGMCGVITIQFSKIVYLWVGWGCESYKDETIQIAVSYRIRVGQNGHEENIWSMSKFAKADSAELRNHRVTLTEEFIKRLPLALNRFIEESRNEG